MSSNGKQLESLVAFVESILLPEGFIVTKNERIFDDDGIQIAEFDIEIHGNVGSTKIAWLIECRDRPSSGPAPGSWIEQLVGRRTRFNFNKVTAVSTTGFATGAFEFALSQGIELREVKSLDPEEFKDWLKLNFIKQIVKYKTLLDTKFIISKTESQAKQKSLKKLLKKIDTNSAFLRSSSTGELSTPIMAFSNVISTQDEIYDQLEPNGFKKRISVNAVYPDNDHFFIDTDKGEVKVSTIIYTGELQILETSHPINLTAEYKHSEDGKVISQVASFTPHSIYGMKFATELHKISETGETHIILRRLSDNT